MLQNGTKLAFETPNDWRELIDSTGSRSEIIRLLIRLLDYVGDKSAYLCLVLAALTLEKSGKVADKHSVAKSVVKLGAQGSDGQSLFRMIKAILDDEEKENMKEESKETV
jgi:hexokinase